MRLIFEDRKKRLIKGKEEIKFSSFSSYHLIKLTARAKGEKQLGPGATDDEDLTFSLDGRSFPKLNTQADLIDSSAAFSGGSLHDLAKTIYLLTSLKGRDHSLVLNADDPPGTATFESLAVYTLNLDRRLMVNVQDQAEDGDRRPWLTFVIESLPLLSFTVAATVKKRYRDSDDLKIVVDGEIKTHFGERKEKPKEFLPKEWFYRFWYFAGSLLLSKLTISHFKTRLPKGLHYIEIYADCQPYVESVDFDFSGAIQKYRDDRFGRNYNQLDQYILNSVKFWNDFFLKQPYPPPEPLDPNFVKALVYRESRLGYYPNDKIIDVMQVWDPENPPQRAFLGETPANEFISPQEVGHISYSYPKEKNPPKVDGRGESIFWGVRWLYYKAQLPKTDESNELVRPYVRLWRAWEEAARHYNANPEIVEDYIREVLKVYREGFDLEGNRLWQN